MGWGQLPALPWDGTEISDLLRKTAPKQLRFIGILPLIYKPYYGMEVKESSVFQSLVAVFF